MNGKLDKNLLGCDQLTDIIEFIEWKITTVYILVLNLDDENINISSSKNRGPDSSFPTPPSDSPKNKLEESTMSTEEFFPRKNSLLSGDIESNSLFPAIHIDAPGEFKPNWSAGYDKKEDPNFTASPSPAFSLPGKVSGPPGLLKSASQQEEIPFRGRISSTPNFTESLQRNSSEHQEPSWAPDMMGKHRLWGSEEGTPSQDSLKIPPNFLPSFLKDGLDSPSPRTTRSFSFSNVNAFGGNSIGGFDESKGFNESSFFTDYKPSSEILNDSNFSFQQGSDRSRSKSFSMEATEDEQASESLKALSLNQRASIKISEIWTNDAMRSNFSPLYHRRASTQPASNAGWGINGDTIDPVVDSGNTIMSQEQIERYREQRKFTHAPSLMSEYIQRFSIMRYFLCSNV